METGSYDALIHHLPLGHVRLTAEFNGEARPCTFQDSALICSNQYAIELVPRREVHSRTLLVFQFIVRGITEYF